MGIADCGKITFTTELQPKSIVKDIEEKVQKLKDGETLSEKLKERCYDRYNIQLSNLSIYLTTGGPSFSKCKKCFILKPFCIEMKVDKSIIPQVIWLPSLNIYGGLPDLEIRMSTYNVRHIIIIGKHFSQLLEPNEKKQHNR